MSWDDPASLRCVHPPDPGPDAGWAAEMPSLRYTDDYIGDNRA